jgi:hypothetical protein
MSHNQERHRFQKTEETRHAVFRHRSDRLHRQATRQGLAGPPRRHGVFPAAARLRGQGARTARVLGRRQGPRRSRAGRPHRQEAGRGGRPGQGAQGQHRPGVPPGRGVRPVGRRGDPGRRQHRGHAQRGRVRQGDRGEALQPRVVHRGRGPVRGRLPRGHVRRSREPGPPVLRHQARVREDRAQGVQGALERLPPGDGGRRFDHGRDGQDRRPVLLLQADPAHAPDPAAVDAGHRPGGRAHQHRAGRLRRRCARPHQPPGAQGQRPRGFASATCWPSSPRPRTRPR